MATSEGQPRPEPEPGRELRADAAADAAPDNVGDRAEENGAGEAPVDPDTESFGFDPAALVAFGDRDAEADRAAREQSPPLAGALRRAAETKAPGGPPFLGCCASSTRLGGAGAEDLSTLAPLRALQAGSA